MDSQEYTFVTELIHIVQVIYSPVISATTIQDLKVLIENHLRKFKELFPDKNIIPKQHYLIHMPEMIKLLRPTICFSCSSFEAARQYFKQTSRKENFKNLPLPLAKRHQLLERSYFGVASENFNSHPLFSSERTFGVLQSVSEEKRKYLRKTFDESALLPGIEDLSGIHKTSWIILFGTKYCIECLIVIGS